jgi:hypothetical protein
MGLNLIGRMNDVLWGYFIHRLSSSPFTLSLHLVGVVSGGP